MLSAAGDTKIYAVNLRYTPQDITTPVPGGYITWFWKLLHKPTHQMRVRIATKIYNSRTLDFPAKVAVAVASGYDTNIFDQPEFKTLDEVKTQDEGWGGMTVDAGGVGAEEQKVLDRVGEDLARLGRVKRVGLGVESKIEFLRVWGGRKR